MPGRTAEDILLAPDTRRAPLSQPTSPAPHRPPKIEINATARPPSPALRSAPAVLPMPTRKKSVQVPLTANSLNSLEREIERLTAACDEHERVIRSTLSTVRHHLLTNMQGILERVAKTDDDAEVALQVYIPAFQDKLRQTIRHRAEDVETMRERTTPWRDVVIGGTASSQKQSGEADQGTLASGGRKLKRVEDGGKGDALTRMEMWADEVEMYLNNEIVRMNESLRVKRTRHVSVYYTVIATLVALGAVGSGFLIYYPSAAIWSWIQHSREELQRA
ncbi:hypothetical protein L198_00122 [Cryptococcus wingfieldii CBS 7118]|uniref:Uncharacterized protein n=1 Tax=Cryptococcus wingfieldii CBS 7118 TaxID=1295528 RepID=A0A1E3K5B6_9TREE|nr:hypothetical protein L198_00122 [Cryptococcus wingfieldii CBS 7118]ODO08394.1 hypothetical protein L198_00122 [Cryptococcus wingfieldii CBS 7118]